MTRLCARHLPKVYSTAGPAFPHDNHPNPVAPELMACGSASLPRDQSSCVSLNTSRPKRTMPAADPNAASSPLSLELGGEVDAGLPTPSFLEDVDSPIAPLRVALICFRFSASEGKEGMGLRHLGLHKSQWTVSRCIVRPHHTKPTNLNKHLHHQVYQRDGPHSLHKHQ